MGKWLRDRFGEVSKKSHKELMHHIIRLFCPRLLLSVKQVWRFDRKPENGDRNREGSDVADCGGHI